MLKSTATEVCNAKSAKRSNTSQRGALGVFASDLFHSSSTTERMVDQRREGKSSGTFQRDEVGRWAGKGVWGRGAVMDVDTKSGSVVSIVWNGQLENMGTLKRAFPKPIFYNSKCRWP